MKHIVRLAAAALVALSLSACAEQVAKFQSAYEVVTATTAAVTPQAMVVARSAFNAAQVLATNYQRLPRCTGANGPICRDPALRTRIDEAVWSGRRARNTIAAFMRSHPGALGPQDTYAALVAATETIKSLTAAYRAAVGQ